MSLTDLYVMDKSNGVIHRIGDNQHDSFWVDREGVLHYYNLQNGDGCSGDGYENGKLSGYAFLPQDVSSPMDYEHYNQPDRCLLDIECACCYPINECSNCPNRERLKERGAD